MTRTVLARLTTRRTPLRPAAGAPLSRLLTRPVLSTVEVIREEIILDRLAILTAASDPWTAATTLFGEAR